MFLNSHPSILLLHLHQLSSAHLNSLRGLLTFKDLIFLDICVYHLYVLVVYMLTLGIMNVITSSNTGKVQRL